MRECGAGRVGGGVRGRQAGRDWPGPTTQTSLGKSLGVNTVTASHAEVHQPPPPPLPPSPPAGPEIPTL